MPEAEVAKIVAAECQRAAERARREGFALGVEHHRSECARELEDERTGVVAQASEMLRDFASERERYFSDVEEEVVQLALEIAECILRRQAASDPLLLSAAVRHALGQLAASTFARFVVPERDADMWKQELARQSAAVGHLSLGSQLQIVADANMQRGDCRIEAGIGNADLGIYSQLEEIERSFFDGIALRRSKSCAEVQQGDLRIDLRPPNSGAVADSECPEAANLEFAAPDSQSLGFAPANVDGADCQASVAQQVDPTAAAEGIGGGQGLQEVEARNPPNWLG